MNYSFANGYLLRSYRNFERSELHHSELQLDVFDCEIGITISTFQVDLNAALISRNLFQCFTTRMWKEIEWNSWKLFIILAVFYLLFISTIIKVLKFTYLSIPLYHSFSWLHSSKNFPLLNTSIIRSFVKFVKIFFYEIQYRLLKLMKNYVQKETRKK